ncbi:hypothetical protein J2Y63_003772 [Shinella sp. BE166]|uniref:hypothetical protein n=1 Tax=Shinella sp. BE166 TaxID=3373918 RepID=UPI003EB99820
MSLHRIAARISAVQALLGRTSVGDNVLDSQISALDVDAEGNFVTNQKKPFISVYSEGSTVKDSQPQQALRSLLPNGSTVFFFETGIAATMTEVDPETDESFVVPGMPSTDASFEFALDMTMRQIGDALVDPENEWAEIFRKLCVSFLDTERSRASGDNKGTRMAAHQLKLTVDLKPDPPSGDTLNPKHPLAMFFAKAAELDDPVVEAQVALMQAQLAGTPFSWELDIARYGMTRTEADNLLLVPPAGAEDDIEISEVIPSDATPAVADGGTP